LFPPSPGASYYASAASLQPAFYLALLDRGWRRSGTLLYKPDQCNSCCPQYTIRLDADGFRASKDQRQALNRFNKYVLGDEYIKEAARWYPRSREQAKKRDTDFDLVERIHEAEMADLPTPPEPAHSLTITLEPSSFTEEKYALYENYQRVVHRDPPDRISKSGFRRFLCNNPLTGSEQEVDGRVRKLGSYHQCYRLDGKLVAVGVLDLLPRCVSAVYFMYHESVAQHNFGKLGALREIALAREEGYRWWYAGFYIHSCTKMRYKGDYSPQFMLDPETYAWNPLDAEMRKRLDEDEHLNLSSETTPSRKSPAPEDGEMDVEEDEESDDDNKDSDDDTPIFARSMPGLLSRAQLLNEADLDNIKIRVQGQVHQTSDLVMWEASSIDSTRSIKGIIAELASAVGVELAKEMYVDFK
jgi:arginine-tRNA-protein transferase